MLLLLGAFPQDRSLARRTGREWLSWSPEERSVFVEAYLAGYMSGKTDACEAAAQLFEPHEHIVDFAHSASARCFQHAKGYSKTVSHYAGLMTDFYTKYPKYGGISDVDLMLLLTGDRYRTADEVYQAALKGEIRTPF